MSPPSTSTTSAAATMSTATQPAPPPPPPPPPPFSAAAPNDLSRSTKMRRIASVSKSLGAPERAGHLKLVSSISKSFDPYAIFLTPHYSDADLARHRGWLRLLPQDYRVPIYVLLWYWPPLCVTTVVSVAVAFYETYGVPKNLRLKSVARSELAVPFQLTSFMMSILLVFRTNTSFQRWDEARKIWGSMCVETRTIARQVRAWVERGEAAARRRRRKKKEKKKEEEEETTMETTATATTATMCDGEDNADDDREDGEEEEEAATRKTLAELLSWCAAAPIALKAAVATDVDGSALLRGVGRCVADGGGFEAVLTSRQRRGLRRAAAGRPLLAPPCVLDRIGRCLASLGPDVLSDILLASIDQRVAAMAALACSADRLKRQPIPPAYTRNTARFLAIWLFFLPLALWNPLRWWSIPACVLISFLLVAVENVGAQLESPHPLLPVDELVNIAVNGVRDAGGRWYLDPHEREQMEGFGGGSGSDDDDDDKSESESESGEVEVAATAVPAPTKETV